MNSCLGGSRWSGRRGASAIDGLTGVSRKPERWTNSGPALLRRLALCLGVLAYPLAASGQEPQPLAVPLEPVANAGTLQPIYRAHGMAMHGEPKYGPDFTHFDYVNPDAPKGGEMRIGAQGTFDSFNPYISRGTPVSPGGDTLLVASADEPFTKYCLICETIEWPEDRSWVIFHIHPEARWHDGMPITPEDVIFSLDILKAEGQPFYRFYYGSVESAEKTGPRSVRFNFSEENNPELPLIAGQLPILPKHYWEERDFARTTLDPPLTSGPYRIVDWEPGRYVVRERVPDYWGKDLPVNRGQDNFDRIRSIFFRDATVIRQALKAGELDYRNENQAKAWATDYDIPVVRDGFLRRVEFPHLRPTGMQAFILNARRPIFQDKRVREALGLAFDFEWTNPALFFGQYDRNYSFFGNSELASRDLPEGRELEILETYRHRLPDEVFERPFVVPATDGSGWPRDNLMQALELLREAGWEIDDAGVLRNVETGRPFVFEMLLVSPDFERIALPFARNLKRLGIDMNLRLVDRSQYVNRLREKDFDMFMGGWGQSSSPGNEQRSYWSSAAAEQPGSRNFAGITDPVIDELIELVIQAPSREELVDRTRALDRVLLWGHYIIPAWHLRTDRILYWDKFAYPEIVPEDGTSTSYWWFDAQKAQQLALAVPAKRRGDFAQNGEVGFDWRKLLGLSFLVLIGTAAWLSYRIGAKKRDERVAVIEP